MNTGVFKIINALLGAVIFFTLALFAKEYMVFRYRPLYRQAVQSVKAPAPAHAAPARTDFAANEDIARGGLFGRGSLAYIDDSPAAAPVSAAGAEAALIGTVAGKSGLGYAIFQDKRAKKQEIFANGEKVFNIGELKAIEERRAVVSSGGRDLVFYLPEDRPPGKEPRMPSDAAPANGGGADGGAGRGPVISRKTGESEWIIDQRALNNVLNDMGKVLTDARLLPYSDGGKVAGFRVTEVRPDGVFGLIGLQNGDVLLRINDYEINSPEKGVQLISGLKGESNLSVDILRGGKPKRLLYQIR